MGYAFEHRNTIAYNSEPLSGSVWRSSILPNKKDSHGHDIAARLDSPATDIPADVLGGSSAANHLSHRRKPNTYLECQKSTISSTTLIVAGLGVVLGIFLIGGGSLWLISRRRAARRNPNLGDREATAGKERQGEEKSRRTVKQDVDDEEEETEDEEEEGEGEPEKLRNERKRTEVVKREKGSPRVDQKGGKSESEDGEEESDEESGDSEEDEDEEDDMETPRPAKTAPPLQAVKIQTRPRQTFGAAPSGTPVLSSSPEPLYPANPSPNPRHLRQSRPLQPSHPFANTKTSTPYRTSSQTVPARGVSPLPPPRAASRTAQSQRRDSVVSVRKGSAGVENGNAPPMPVRRQTEGNTRPLTIRKSSASTLMPSYYETPAHPLPTLPSVTPGLRSLADRRAAPGQVARKSPPSSVAPPPSLGERRPNARAGAATGGPGMRAGDGRRPSDRGAMI
ncbi:hypothetical protein JCM24511_08459 [Saitozyma sp. JCM 24511]|nr:hypothetical protein JCM24511_08459 [Saitozyma sp. JCM 24511]